MTIRYKGRKRRDKDAIRGMLENGKRRGRKVNRYIDIRIKEVK